MSKSSQTSERFNLSVPRKVLEFYRSCQNMKNFTAFVRIAIIEKLNRDFKFNIDSKEGDFLQGKRTDLFDEENKAKKLPELRRQAERARAGKNSPPRGGNVSAKSPCSSGRRRGASSEKSSSAAASSSAPR